MKATRPNNSAAEQRRLECRGALELGLSNNTDCISRVWNTLFMNMENLINDVLFCIAMRYLHKFYPVQGQMNHHIMYIHCRRNIGVNSFFNLKSVFS